MKTVASQARPVDEDDNEGYEEDGSYGGYGTVGACTAAAHLCFVGFVNLYPSTASHTCNVVWYLNLHTTNITLPCSNYVVVVHKALSKFLHYWCQSFHCSNLGQVSF